jgi:hypothetical protein
MATVQGIREKIQQPLIDSIHVEPAKQLRDLEPGSTLKFFVNVQGKTKLETNLQSASLLPHYNTFEARAMRVVISDLPPEFSEEVVGSGANGEEFEEFDITNDDGDPLKADGTVAGAGDTAVTADLELDLARLVDLLKEARESDDKEVVLDVDDDAVTVFEGDQEIDPSDDLINNGAISVSAGDLEAMILALDKKAPPLEQIRPNDGAGNLIGKLVYNTVTTLFVGEKIMIEMPTWFFPGGAGPYSFASNVISHGEPSPMATFRFAEPIFIDKQQNFRVEIDIPDSDTHKEIQKIYGPLFIWVVLDGYLTRDVQ